MTDWLAARFHKLWQNTCRRGGVDAFRILDMAYASPARSYHSWSHIVGMLQELDQVRDLPEFGCVAFDEVELAVFFHDAVYDPRRHDNEERSAALFLELASSAPATEELRAHVVHLILATALHEAGKDKAEQLLIDLDLGIIGAHPPLYASYVAGIRREHHHVPDPRWISGRRLVLERFLARQRIYQTDYFHHRLEVAARANLAAERQHLGLNKP